MPDKLALTVCENLAPEVTAAVQAEGWHDVVVVTFPGNCGRPPLGWEDLADAVGDMREYSQVAVIGSACISCLGVAPKALAAFRVHRLEQCFHLFCTRRAVESQQKEGAYLLTPGWLARWRHHIDLWGFDRQTAREFLGEFATRLLLLDTEVVEESGRQLAEFADFLGLPADSTPVGLDHCRLYLGSLVQDWRLEQERARAADALAQAGRQAAEYAMAADLVGGLTKIVTEAEAIANILEMFALLFAPSRAVYLPLVGGKPGRPQSRPAGLAATADVLPADLSEEHAWTASGSGFRLRVDHQGEVLGLLEVDGIAFPEYKERYLNLALAIGKVCGLAIANARTYERVKRTEGELEAERERLEVTLCSIGDGVIATDRGGRVVMINSAAEQMTGWGQEAAVGRPLREVFHIVSAKTGRECDNPAEKALQTNAVVNLEDNAYLVSRDGSRRSIADSAAPIRDRGGNSIGAVLVFRDVTDRKRAEDGQRLLAKASEPLAASLLDHETALRAIARLAVPALAEWCAVDILEEDGSLRQSALAHVDPAKERLLRELRQRHPLAREGQHPVARVLRSGRSLLIPESPSWLLGDLPRGELGSEEAPELATGGAMVVPLLARGRTLGIMMFVSAAAGRYGTADLALAEVLAHRCAVAIDNARLYREAQEAVRVRNEFLSSVSHDLKNPLTAIKGMAQLLRRQAARAGTPETERLISGLSTIDATAMRMAEMINELLDLARLQRGQPISLELRETDIVGLVRQVVNVHQQGTDRHDIRVEADTPSLVGEWDPVRLERVLANLLSNAIKYSPEGGRIVITVTREESAEGDRAVIAVQDRGLGIPEDDVSRIFTGFHRASNIAGRIGGTGLGLVSARQIVEQHGGTISVESKEGLGSTFTVRLPLHPPRLT